MAADMTQYLPGLSTYLGKPLREKAVTVDFHQLAMSVAVWESNAEFLGQSFTEGSFTCARGTWSMKQKSPTEDSSFSNETISLHTHSTVLRTQVYTSILRHRYNTYQENRDIYYIKNVQRHFAVKFLKNSKIQ